MQPATTGLLTLHGSILSIHASIVSVHGHLWLYSEPPQAEDPDQAIDFDVDQDQEVKLQRVLTSFQELEIKPLAVKEMFPNYHLGSSCVSAEGGMLGIFKSAVIITESVSQLQHFETGFRNKIVKQITSGNKIAVKSGEPGKDIHIFSTYQQ